MSHFNNTNMNKQKAPMKIIQKNKIFMGKNVGK